MAFYFFSFLSHMHYHLTKSKWIWTSDYFSCDFHISRCCRRQSRLYLFLNFSTLPPRFINFCCPVKNGWHSEQTSNLISSSVDIVTNELPHAQVTLHSLYSGWIPSFMLFHLFPAQAMPLHICCKTALDRCDLFDSSHNIPRHRQQNNLFLSRRQ